MNMPCRAAKPGRREAETERPYRAHSAPVRGRREGEHMAYEQILYTAESGAFWEWLTAHDAWMQTGGTAERERMDEADSKLAEIRRMIAECKK